MLTPTTLSPKTVAATILATVTPYLVLLLTQYADTGIVDAADVRKFVAGLVTGAITFLGAYLSAPGKVVTVLDEEAAERFGIIGPDDGPHL